MVTRSLYTNVHSSFIHNGQELEASQTFTHPYVTGKTVIMSTDGIKLHHKHQQNSDTMIGMKSNKHYAKQKISNTKEYILFHLYEITRKDKTI